MTRQEFLDELRIALQGEISQGRVNEHLRYYENYIMEEARKGKSEQQVMEELGNPRLIAKTLIDTAGGTGKEYEEKNYDQGYGQASGQQGQASRGYGQATGGFQADYSQEGGWDIRYGGFKLNSWYGKLLLIVIAILVIILVAKLVAFLLPIVIPVVLVLLALSLILGNRR